MDRAFGHVEYQSKENALKMGLVKYDNNEVYIGADHNTSLAGSSYRGRPSVRLEAKEAYERGLFIARFTHLPSATCGSWPAL